MGRAGEETQGSSSWLFLLSPHSQILYQGLANLHILPSTQAWKSQGSSSLHGVVIPATIACSEVV